MTAFENGDSVFGPSPMSRRRLVGLGSVAASSVVVAACGAQQSAGREAGTKPQAAGQTATVRIMGTFVDQTQGEKLWAQWKQEIAAKEPGVNAEFIVQPRSDIADKLLAQVAAGDAPDVIQGTTIEYAARGLLADLTAQISKDKILEQRKYFKKPVEAAKFNGKFWAMPGGLSAYVFWVNLDMLKNAGIEAPKDGKFTFDDFVAWGQKVTRDTDGDGKTDQWAYDASNWFSRMPPLIWANGGDMFEYNKAFNLLTKPTWDMAQTWEAIQWQADLVTRHRISPAPSDADALKASTFEGGKMLFKYGGGWLLTDFRNKIGSNFRWAALRTPVKKASDKPQEMVPAFLRGSILKDTKNRDAAWKALRYISGPEGNVGYRTYVTDELIFDTPEEINRYVSQSSTANTQLLVDAAREAGERPFYKSEVRALYGWASDMVPAMNEEFKPIYEGQANAKEAVTKLQPRLVNIIQKGKEAGMDPEKPNIKLG
ncbi:MAG TPA: extracellular solute-binding protein [Chloroflexota bacterium]|nr:extracellular solute-binding protein [Chloroflexota bacterium]